MAEPSYNVPPEMREFAERSVDQARSAFDTFMGAAQRAMGASDTPITMQSVSRKGGDKAATFAEQNIRSALDYASKVVRVNDMQELMALQSEYMRAQLASLTVQSDPFTPIASSSQTQRAGSKPRTTSPPDGESSNDDDLIHAMGVAVQQMSRELFSPEDQSAYVRERIAEAVKP